MNRKTILLPFIIMFFTVASNAQKRQGGAMHWEIASCIPAADGQPKALGLAGPVAGIHSDVLIIGGGANFPDKMPWEGGQKKYYDEVFIYFKQGNKIITYSRKFRLAFPVAYAANCSSTHGIVYAGGENEKGISDKVFLLQWDTRDSSLITKGLPDLPIALTNASAAVHNDIVFVAGGEMTGSVSDKLYCLDMNNLEKGWKQLPDIPKPVSHAVAIIQPGSNHSYIYLIGGRKKNNEGLSDSYRSVFRYDIGNNKWEEKSDLPYSLSAASGIAVDPGHLLLFGGDKGEIFHQVEKILLDIHHEKSEAKKQLLIGQKNKLQLSHPGFTKEILLYDISKDKWTVSGHMSFDAPVTTTAVRWHDKVILPSGEIKAGIRTPKILAGKIVAFEK